MATKKTTTQSAEPIDTALATGVEAMIAFGKDNAEAVMKSANAAGKGIESINTEAFAYARKSAEESVAVAKAVLSSKTIEQAFQLQSEFGKAILNPMSTNWRNSATWRCHNAARCRTDPGCASAFADLVRVA